MNRTPKGYLLLFNPFIRYGDNAVYLGGGMLFLLSIFLAWLTGTHLSGFFLYSLSSGYPLKYFVSEQLFQSTILMISFYLSGMLLSRSRIRLIDITGSLLIARIPFLFPVLIRMLPIFHSFVIYSSMWVLYKLLFYLCAAWSLILTYNAVQVSTNLPLNRLPWTFATVIILCEVTTYSFITDFLEVSLLPL